MICKYSDHRYEAIKLGQEDVAWITGTLWRK